jgi:hypothetical protein
MVSCLNTYEFYITSVYAMDWHLQEDNGSIDHGVVFAKKSDESEHPGAITFVDLKQADAPVVWRAENVDGEIVTTAIMLLNPKNLPTKSPWMDVWVFDTLAVVKMMDGSFAFFEKPMVMGMHKDPIVGSYLTDNTTLPYLFNFNAYALAACCDDGNSIEFYGVLDTQIMKWTFTFDPDAKQITVTQDQALYNCTLEGKIIKTAVSEDFLIVSCTDCDAPVVNFYDRQDLSLVKSYAYSGPFGTAAINIALYQNDFNSLSVFIAANDQID